MFFFVQTISAELGMANGEYVRQLAFIKNEGRVEHRIRTRSGPSVVWSYVPLYGPLLWMAARYFI